jgi:hypothetical protein
MCRTNNDLLKSITMYVNLAAAGQFPQWYYDVMAEARLIALAKKEESESGAKGVTADLLKDLRPIAMGTVWRKLVSKSVQHVYRGDHIKIFEAYQFGAGAKLGTETLHHIVKNALKDNPDWLGVKVDCKNAFNSVLRRKLLAAVEKYCPGMYPWVKVNHINVTKLWHTCAELAKKEADFLNSEEGVQQGEVGGPVNFCLAIQEILEELNLMLVVLGGGALYAYMDDLIMLGPVNVVCEAWPTLVRKLKDVGLVVNTDKCQVYHPDAEVRNKCTLPTEITRKHDGIVMVGVPLGSDQYVHDYWKGEFDAIKEEIDTVCRYEDTQVALLFLSKCVSTKLNYYCRLTDPNSLAGSLGPIIDAALRKGLQQILMKQTELTDDVWSHATLATKDGGLGIQTPVISHHSAHLASIISCAQVISGTIATNISDDKQPYQTALLQNVVSRLHIAAVPIHANILENSVSGGSVLTPLEDLLVGSCVKLQKKLTLHVSNNNFQKLFNKSTVTVTSEVRSQPFVKL